MALLLVSSFLTDDKSLAYGLLLLATASLGAGFGFTVPALNTFTAAFNPTAVRPLDPRAQRAARARNGAGAGVRRDLRRPRLLVGSAARRRRCCSSCSSSSACVCRCRSQVTRAATASARLGIPRRFWVYAGFAVLYGICETVNGNWSQLDMTSELGASTTRGRSCAHRVLGDGDRRASRLRCRPARRPRQADVPRAAVRARGGVRAHLRCFPMTSPLSAFSRSASRGSGARRFCRSRSASARRS